MAGAVHHVARAARFFRALPLHGYAGIAAGLAGRMTAHLTTPVEEQGRRRV